jgi:hypothetical protein
MHAPVYVTSIVSYTDVDLSEVLGLATPIYNLCEDKMRTFT